MGPASDAVSGSSGGRRRQVPERECLNDVTFTVAYASSTSNQPCACPPPSAVTVVFCLSTRSHAMSDVSQRPCILYTIRRGRGPVVATRAPGTQSVFNT